MKRTKKQVSKKNKLEVFTSPESSNVEGGSYSRESKQAVIAFRDKKDPEAKTVYYEYDNFLPEDWDGLIAAESKGKYLRKLFIVEKKYAGKKIA